MFSLPTKQFHAILQGDVRKALAQLPSDSVDCVITSPPYWGLRDYKLPPAVWDGVEACEHDFRESEEVVRFNKTKFLRQSPDTIVPESELHEYRKRGDAFCSKCSAWKGQLGLEPTFQLYVKHIVNIFHEVKRVLKPTGSLYLNLGDTYFAHNGTRGNKTSAGADTLRNDYDNEMVAPRFHATDTFPSKCLIGIPERVMLAMIDDGWILRNALIWHKPNHMPSSVKDRFSNSYEFVYFFVKQSRYYFDLDAVREPHKASSIERDNVGYHTSPMLGRYQVPWEKRSGTKDQSFLNPSGKNLGDVIEDKQSAVIDPNTNAPKRTYAGFNERYDDANPPNGGKNPSDFWEITTQPFPEAHFATFPEKLVERPIKASCPSEICVKCGKARERISTVDYEVIRRSRITDQPKVAARISAGDNPNASGFKIAVARGIHSTVGWTSCSCNTSYRSGIVLDPFAGSGTVALVAKNLQRSSISIELKPEYVEIMKKRTGFGQPTINDSIEWLYSKLS